jgi:hypothetical protein
VRGVVVGMELVGQCAKDVMLWFSMVVRERWYGSLLTQGGLVGLQGLSDH